MPTPPSPQQFWLMKSEPDVFSLSNLEHAQNQTSGWDGVRNFQARNFLRAMRQGDLALFYHSSCPEPGVVGVMEIVREAYPDVTALDPNSPYHDPRLKQGVERWFMVDVQWRRTFPQLVALETIKSHPQLCSMRVAKRGNRLSITPVTAEEFNIIVELGNQA